MDTSQYKSTRLTKPEKNKDIAITKSNKGNEVVIFDQKLYNNAIQK